MKLPCVMMTVMIVLTLIVICVMIKFASEINVEERRRDYLETGIVSPLRQVLGLVSLNNDTTLTTIGKKSPFIAVITRNGSTTWKFTCFGCLIVHNWILTAAHCRAYNHKHRILLLGELARNISHTRPVLYWKIHESYNSTNKPKYDIALVKLPPDEMYAMQPARLRQLVFTEVYANIWKTVLTSTSKIYLTNEIERFDFKIVGIGVCIQWFGVTLDDSFVCLDMSMYDDCLITEFGPLFQDDRDVVGILAIQPPRCLMKLSVFTNVSYYIPWIFKTMALESMAERARPRLVPTLVPTPAPATRTTLSNMTVSRPVTESEWKLQSDLQMQYSTVDYNEKIHEQT